MVNGLDDFGEIQQISEQLVNPNFTERDIEAESTVKYYRCNLTRTGHVCGAVYEVPLEPRNMEVLRKPAFGYHICATTDFPLSNF